MSKSYLVNTVRSKGKNGPVLFHAGALIDSSQIDVTLVTGAGGILAPTTYPTVAAQAAIVQGLRQSGEDRERPDLDVLMMAAWQADSVGLDQNRASSTAVAGATVAAAAAISGAVTITPAYSGKLAVRAWMSGTFTPGVVTPLLKNGGTTVAAPAQSAATPIDVEVEVELTGLTLGTPVTINWVTTGGDATVTLGNGVTGAGAGIFVREVP
jgi:hypothetical protein